MVFCNDLAVRWAAPWGRGEWSGRRDDEGRASCVLDADHGRKGKNAPGQRQGGCRAYVVALFGRAA